MVFNITEVKRHFLREIGKKNFDVFSIALWKGLEDMMSDVAQIERSLLLEAFNEAINLYNG